MFTNLIVIIGTLTLVSLASHALKLPVIAGFLLAGIICGPHGLGLVSSVPDVEILAETSAILLMFTIGLEFSFKRMLQIRKVLFALGMGQVVITTAVIGFCLHHFLHLSVSKALFLGAITSLSSSAVVLKLLEESRDMESPYGQASLAVLLFQDLAVIPLLLVMPILAGQGANPSVWQNARELSQILIEGTIVVAIIFTASRFVVPAFLERAVRTKSKEVFFFAVLFICVGTASGMANMGLSLSLGAFFAGLMISESPFGRQAVADFIPFRNNFLGLFFVAIGMLLDPIFIFQHFVTFVLLFLSVFLIKFLCLFFIMWLFGNSSPLAIITALLLVQTGEFSLILAEKGLRLDLLNEEENQYFLGVAILSLALTPMLYKWAPMMGYRSKLRHMIPRPIQELAQQLRATLIREPLKVKMQDQHREKGDTVEGHTIIIGFGLTGQNIAYALKYLKIPYRAIDLNNDTVKKFSAEGEPIIWGDATRDEILESVSLRTARLAIVCTSGSQGTEAVVHAIRRHRSDIQLIVRVQFFRDLDAVEITSHREVVVAEFETTLEVLNRCLKSYGVSPKNIHQFVTDTRKRLKNFNQTRFSAEETRIDLPAWDILSNLRPLILDEDSPVIGKSLADLDLRRRCGVFVVSLYRPDLGASLPDPDLILASQDVLYLLGSPESIIAAEEVLCAPYQATETHS